MDEDKSDSNSADENKWGARWITVRMTHHIQTPQQSVIQSCFKQMGERTAVCFNWSHMRYQAHSPFKTERMLLSVQFSPRYLGRILCHKDTNKHWLGFLLFDAHPLYTLREQYLLPVLGCEAIRLCAIKQSNRFTTKCRWVGFYDSRGHHKKNTTQHNPMCVHMHRVQQVWAAKSQRHSHRVRIISLKIFYSFLSLTKCNCICQFKVTPI